MTYRGTVKSGVVVLPEGTDVVVTLLDETPATSGELSIWTKLSDLGR